MNNSQFHTLLAFHEPQLTYRDFNLLSKKVKNKNFPSESHLFHEHLEGAIVKYRTRLSSVPEISIPKELSISDHVDDIISQIKNNHVIILSGETGSGKSTQLPKIALATGYGVKGMVGITQPRRIAARSVADRLSEELGTHRDKRVGCSMRFSDHTDEETLIKVMTDGILLTEITRDPMLHNYDLIIIDEAHERSITIDFLLGYISTLIDKRPELRFIITSATVNTELLAQFFATTHKQPPIISISGRTYPVEIRYRPQELLAENLDPHQGLLTAITELYHEDKGRIKGDILIFFAREHEIKLAHEKLSGNPLCVEYEIIPLYARLSIEQQRKIFTHSSKPRIILATNVAETSITVPRVRYVIDNGTARIARYSTHTKVMRLPVEPISQASANQRSGRCGRTEPGIAIRLYDECDYHSRIPFTEPEIMRTNLASVILHMGKLKFAPIIEFPFVDRPKDRALQEAVQSLIELGALPIGSTIYDHTIPLTDYGKTLTQLPIDPRLGRMLIAAKELGVLDDVLIIAAALSIGDIRLVTDYKNDSSKHVYAPFINKKSDFLFFLNIYNHLISISEKESRKKFNQEINQLYLHQTRVREWFNLIDQLRKTIRSLKWRIEKEPSTLPNIHKALLSGILPNIGMFKEKNTTDKSFEYQGIKTLSFHISPSSILYKKPTNWVMAFELVETSKIYAHICGAIEPEWVENYIANDCKKQYTNIRWNARRSEVVATEKVLYKGLPIIDNRTVPYSAIDPALSRQLFIQHALIMNECNNQYPFFKKNQEILDTVNLIENKIRSHNLIVDEENVYNFFDKQIPENITMSTEFDYWYKHLARPQSLEFTLSEILEGPLPEDLDSRYPQKWVQGKISLDLEYFFDPASENDGVSVLIPLRLLPFISPTGFDWHITGYRNAMIRAIFSLLPKAYRKNLNPLERAVNDFCNKSTHHDTKLTSYLAKYLSSTYGITDENLEKIIENIHAQQLPAWLKIKFVVIDKNKRTLAISPNLRSLHNKFRSITTPVLASASILWSDPSSFPDFEATTQISINSYELPGYNAIKYTDKNIRLNTYSHRKIAEKIHLQSLVELLRDDIISESNNKKNSLYSPLSLDKLGLSTELSLSLKTYEYLDSLFNDALTCTIQSLIEKGANKTELALKLPYSSFSYITLLETIKKYCTDEFIQHIQFAAKAIDSWSKTQMLYSPYLDNTGKLGEISRNIHHHHRNLMGERFLKNTPSRYIPRLAVYAHAQCQRLETVLLRGADSLEKDFHKTSIISELEKAFLTKITNNSLRLTHTVRWLLEELKVSMYAQNLGTITSVSPQKILEILEQ